MTDKLARGIWPALVTPFTDDGTALAADRVEPLIRHLLDAGSQGFFVCGGTGEGAAMTVSERKAMTETTIAAVAGAVPLIFQVGGTATDNAVELAQHAARAGANAVASVAPVTNPTTSKPPSPTTPPSAPLPSCPSISTGSPAPQQKASPPSDFSRRWKPCPTSAASNSPTATSISSNA